MSEEEIKKAAELAVHRLREACVLNVQKEPNMACAVIARAIKDAAEIASKKGQP